MSKEKIKGFMLFVDQRAAIECLPDSLAGKLLKACYAYADDGSLPTFEEPLLMPVFLMTKTQIDNSKLAYEKSCSVNKANAQKRYASKKDSSITTASDGMQSHSAESDGKLSDAKAANNNPNNKDNNKSKDNHNNMSNNYVDEIHRQGRKFLDEYLSELTESKLTEEQELTIVKLSIETIEADNKIEYSEVSFFKEIRCRLHVSDEAILKAIPGCEDYLLPDIRTNSILTDLNLSFKDIKLDSQLLNS